MEEAIQLLIDANRIPEAAFMARTYMPSQISRYICVPLYFFSSCFPELACVALLTVELTCSFSILFFYWRYHLLFFYPVFFRVLEIWKRDLKTINEKAAEALADPVKFPNLFPDLSWALKVCS